MSDIPPPRLAEIPLRVRQILAELPGRWRTWREGLREDPSLLWRTPLVRILAVLIVVVIALLVINWLISALTPSSTRTTFEQATPWATLYVACTNPACRASYTVQEAMNFKDWPLQCQRCGQRTVYRATLCQVCRNWYANPLGTTAGCPHCAAAKTGPATSQPKTDQQRRSDDDEDPW